MTSAHSERPPVTVRVPAKVNLELLVGPLRPDGYHTLSTVYQAVSLYDDVTVATADEWGSPSRTPGATGCPTDGTTWRCGPPGARCETGLDIEPVHITIRKGIPVAGGMAGGRPTRPRRSSPATGSGPRTWARRSSSRYAARAGLRRPLPHRRRDGRRVSGRGEVMAPVLARGPTTGSSPSPRAACRPRRSTPSATACVATSRTPSRARR
jgi:4-diphosphocytidyl-2-C-methyl-D-erythritol kinase